MVIIIQNILIVPYQKNGIKGIDVDNYQPSNIGDLSDCFCIYNISKYTGNFTITVNTDPGNTAYPYTLYVCKYQMSTTPKFTRITSKTVDISLGRNEKCYFMRRCSEK